MLFSAWLTGRHSLRWNGFSVYGFDGVRWLVIWWCVRTTITRPGSCSRLCFVHPHYGRRKSRSSLIWPVLPTLSATLTNNTINILLIVIVITIIIILNIIGDISHEHQFLFSTAGHRLPSKQQTRCVFVSCQNGCNTCSRPSGRKIIFR